VSSRACGLRDNVREDRDPHNGQRLVDITDLPEKPRIRAARGRNRAWCASIGKTMRGARVFELDWLAAHAFAAASADRSWRPGPGSGAPGSSPPGTSPGEPCRAARGLAVRLTWLTRLLQDGWPS